MSVPNSEGWTSSAPERWKRSRLKYLVRFMGGATPSKEKDEYWNGNIPWISPKDMKSAEITEAIDHISVAGLASSATKLIPAGSILVVVRSGILRHTLPVSINAIPVALNQDLKALVPGPRLSAKFLRYFLLGGQRAILEELRKQGATVESIEQSLLANAVIPLPPLSEQIEMATFLDLETEKAEILIQKSRALIDLLNEKRSAMITRAITKGLGPDPSLKPSGDRHLGDVPQTWRISPAKYLFSLVTSGSRGWADFYADSGDLFLRIANLTRTGIDLDLSKPRYVRPPNGTEGQRTEAKINDLLVSITADLGSIAIVPALPGKTYVSQHVALCRPVGTIDARWLAYAFFCQATKDQLLDAGYGGTKMQLSLDDVRNVILAVPPIEEQREIVRWLEPNIGQIDLLLGATSTFIDVVAERNFALISSVVLGVAPVQSREQQKAAV